MNKLTQEWVDRVTRSDDPEPAGCIACGAIAGCCDKYPNCPGNSNWELGRPEGIARMDKHTPGPWMVVTESPNPYWRGDGTEVASDYGRIASTHVDGLRDLEECRANARLIAAAPGMAAELIELRSKLPSWVNAAERLPENTALVLTWVVDDEDGFARAYVMHHHKTYGWTSWFPMTHARVTHWMPLPEPPK